MVSRTLLFALTTLVALATSTDKANADQPNADQPNVVLIFTDDQGYHDVGCYGSEIATPNIDSLARDGIKFTQWYSASSICTPSRFGLMTGRNPSRSHDQLLSALMFLGEADKTRGIHQNEITVAARMHAAGYETALIGKWHLGHGDAQFLPTRHGFDSFFGHTGGCVDFFTMRYGNSPDWYRNEELVDITGYATDVITDEAEQFLSSRSDEKPFFLYLSYNAPHFGKGWNDGESTTVNQLQPPPEDLARVASIEDITRRKYAAKVVNLDDNIGRVLTSLDNAGVRENTIVIFITDHGGDARYGGANAPYRDGKATLFEGGIRVPCLIRWPAVVAAGRVSDDRLWSLDIAPTLAAIAGIEFDETTFDGVDISPTLYGKHVDYSDRPMFWQTGRHLELDRGSWTAYRRGDWKYVRDNKGQPYLFNIASDPTESKNLAANMNGRLQTLQSAAKHRAKTLTEN